MKVNYLYVIPDFSLNSFCHFSNSALTLFCSLLGPMIEYNKKIIMHYNMSLPKNEARYELDCLDFSY